MTFDCNGDAARAPRHSLQRPCSAVRKTLHPTSTNPYKASNGRLIVECPNCYGRSCMKRVASYWRLRWCSKCNIVWKMQ
jgi:hypothetical protein